MTITPPRTRNESEREPARRVLDVDLDFFVYGTSHEPAQRGLRLDPNEYEAWSPEDALAFLETNCGLTERLPGRAVERHDETYFKWRDAISTGKLASRFYVAHLDAHADLGLWDDGYIYLLSELLHKPVDQRSDPKLANADGWGGLGEGNYLAFAIACRWISELVYVMGGRHQDDIERGDELTGRPTDVLVALMPDFDLDAPAIQLPKLDPDDLQEHIGDWDRLQPLTWEPEVPFSYLYGPDFHASEPFDLIYLARSPTYTPPTADPVYEAIRSRFINEDA
jgi:UPF0489 domain